MVKSCVVPNCYQTFEKGVTFHMFPIDDELKQKWLAAIGNNNTVSPVAVVCSNHFIKSDFVVRYGCKSLRKGIVPSVFTINNNSTGSNFKKPAQKKSLRRVDTNSVIVENTLKSDCIRRTLKPNEYYIPQYILIPKHYVTDKNRLNMDLLKTKKISEPVLYGIGNTSTAISSNDAITSSFLDNLNSQTSSYSAEVSRNIKMETDSSTPLGNLLESNGNKESFTNESFHEESHGKSDVSVESCGEKEYEQIEVRNSSKRIQVPRYLGECTTQDLLNPATSKITWSIIERTLSKQRNQIESLNSMRCALKKELKELTNDVQKLKKVSCSK